MSLQFKSYKLDQLGVMLAHTVGVQVFILPLWSSGQSFWLQIQMSWIRFLSVSCFSVTV
jgi:hypothetical protein